jgi:hypothetical protein
MSECQEADELVLAEFSWDSYYGYIGGLFVAHKSEIESAYGSELYFGEVLGKHSDVCGTFSPEDIEIKSTDREFILKLVEVMDDSHNISGYNPLEYLYDELP